MKEILIIEGANYRRTVAATNLEIRKEDDTVCISNGSARFLLMKDTEKNREELRLILTAIYVYLVADPANSFMLLERVEESILMRVRDRYVYYRMVDQDLK